MDDLPLPARDTSNVEEQCTSRTVRHRKRTGGAMRHSPAVLLLVHDAREREVLTRRLTEVAAIPIAVHADTAVDAVDRDDRRRHRDASRRDS